MVFNSKIGLGTVQFGIKYGISNTAGQVSEEEVVKILNSAYDKGIRVIDTAPAYGDAEKTLGKYDLSKFKVISKFMTVQGNNTVTKQLQNSLVQLNVDNIYAYLAHRPLGLMDDKSQWPELQNLKEQGKVKKIGFSLNSPDEIELLVKNDMVPDIIQVPYNYFDNRFKDHIIQLKKSGCEIHARSAFLQGLFFMDTSNLSSFFDEVKNEIFNLQLKYRSELSKVLLNYVAAFDFIDHVIIGVESEKQLIANLQKSKSTYPLPQCNRTVSELILMPSNWPIN
jgi:aryl-alcohol dehydrogenase-like predicted oxidoreductase